MSARAWSLQQDAIFAFFVEALGHLIVRARAGTGKTTTIVEAVKRYLDAHPGRRVVVCAFNKRIADELVTRFAGYAVEVKTLHSLGYAAVRRFWERMPIENKDQKGLRSKGLTETVCGQRVPDAVKRLVMKLHTLGREIAPHATRPGDLIDLAYAFECEPDEEWQAGGWTVEFVEEKALAAMELAVSKRPAFIDFADMIFLPVRNGWLNGYADLVVVDEAQDMTVAQLEIARGICKRAGGRIAVVGDDRQAIYGFRGADAGSLDRLKGELGATELGLTTTYRCGRRIVDLAAQIVPDFQAGPANPEGRVNALPEEKLVDAAALGDFVLSRVNAPLVATAMQLLRAGKRTRVAGRDIGSSLITLVKKISKSARTVPEFLERLAGWQEREVSRIKRGTKNEEAAEKRIEEVADRVEMLKNLSDDARNVAEIEERIAALFTDDGLGQAGVITCSSVHRAKGLEAERVFILADTLKSHTIEEMNIQYVAITRAKQELVFVGAGGNPAGAAEIERQEEAAWKA